jgi:ribosomal protein S1
MNEQEKHTEPANAPEPASQPPPEAQTLPAPAGPGEQTAPAKEQAGKQYRSAWQSRSQARPASKPAAPPETKPAPPPRLPPQQRQVELPRMRDLDAEIQSELEEMMSGLSDKEIYGEPERATQRGAAAEPGPKKARVIAVHSPDVFLDVPGGRSQGVLPLQQFEEGPPAIGTEVLVSIEGYDEANGLLLLARQGAAVVADWSTVAPGMIVEARVLSTNKGGLTVDVNGIRGFMPVSQIDLYRVEDTEQFVNQRLRCVVTDVDPAERNLVVSRRALQEKEREEAREKLWLELAEGQTREGIVRSIKDFGAFVDLGGVDGLLHVSEMSWSRVEKADQLVKVGQKVTVLVLKIDPERRKVSLGLKQLTASPWDSVGLTFPEGSVARGKITRLADFGAFVELEPGIEGLIHISELAPQRVRRVADVVQAGQEVQVMILAIDKDQRRISLSLKAALPKEAEPEEEEAELPLKPPRTRTTPLRGGIGSE